MQWEGPVSQESMIKLVAENSDWPFETIKAFSNNKLTKGSRRCKICHVEKSKEPHSNCTKCPNFENCPSGYIDGHEETKEKNVRDRAEFQAAKKLFTELKRNQKLDEKNQRRVDKMEQQQKKKKKKRGG